MSQKKEVLDKNQKIISKEKWNFYKKWYFWLILGIFLLYKFITLKFISIFEINPTAGIAFFLLTGVIWFGVTSLLFLGIRFIRSRIKRG